MHTGGSGRSVLRRVLSNLAAAAGTPSPTPASRPEQDCRVAAIELRPLPELYTRAAAVGACYVGCSQILLLQGCLWKG